MALFRRPCSLRYRKCSIPTIKATIAAIALIVSNSKACSAISNMVNNIPPNPVPIATISAEVLFKTTFFKVVSGGFLAAS